MEPAKNERVSFCNHLEAALIKISTSKTAAVHTSARSTPHFMGHHCAGRCIPQRHAGFREPPISEDLREQRDEWDAVRVSEIERVGRAKLQVYGAGKGWHQLGRESLRLRVVLSSD